MKLTSHGKDIRIVVATPHSEESFKKGWEKEIPTPWSK